jgi:hypothetical protein
VKYFILFLIHTLFNNSLQSQKSGPISSSQYGNIMTIEKKMQRIGYQLLGDTVQENRLKGAREFVKLLVEALRIDNSFKYKFDSLPYLAKVYPEDSSFRIFTFQVMLKNYTYVHYGAIQLNRKSVKLIPFKDFSDTFSTTPKGIFTNKNWYGAVYYKIFTKTINNRPLYFLFGYDQNDVLSDKKYIEPMQIIGDTTAKFGYPIFEKRLPPSTILDPRTKKPLTSLSRKAPKLLNRYVLDYRKGGTAALKYEKDKNRIIFEHLAPIDKKSFEVGYMMLSDGTYEGFTWQDNHWLWQETMTVAERDDNRPIRPVPMNKSKGYKAEE